jgi:ATP-binding cassette subfamily B multidrug efflux pump
MWYWDDVISPDDKKYIRRMSIGEMVRRVAPLFSSHRKFMILAIIFMLMSVGVDLAGPLVLRYLIDVAIPNGSTMSIVWMGIAYSAIFMGGMVFTYLQFVVLTRIGLSVITDLKTHLFTHILTLSAAFFDRNPPGRLMARVESDAERIRMLFAEVAVALLRSFLYLVGAFLILMAYDIRLTLVLVGLLTPVFVGAFFVFRYVRTAYGKIRHLYARISSFLAEYVQGIPILQVFGQTRWAQRKLQHHNQAKFKAELGVAFVEYGYFGLIWTMEVVAVILILWMGFRNILGIGMTIGKLVLFVEYTRHSFWPIVMFTEQLNFIQRALASTDRVFSILDTPSKTPDYPGARDTIPEDWQELAFENVSFAYEGGPQALDSISFTLRRGERVALAGISGGGKSTITSLLLRFYEPTSGRITLDGADIREFKQRSWRRKIGLVLQDIHLFPGTLGANLRALADDIPDEALHRAVQTIKADEVVSRLPQGLDTPLAEGGQNLSMGERQLISFSRALVRDPDILVLDEATSSVDPGTERRIQESLDRMMAGRTSLVIAHRLSTIIHADRILVVHKGRLVEEGTHRELYRRGGLYRDLFELQFRTQEVA